MNVKHLQNSGSIDDGESGWARFEVVLTGNELTDLMFEVGQLSSDAPSIESLVDGLINEAIEATEAVA